jgi:hypothetical protein
MIVNGWSLPSAFQAFLDHYPDPGRVWDLKASSDTPGLRERQFIPFANVEQMTASTESLAKSFKRLMELGLAKAALAAARPGSVPLIDDYSQIVQFGNSPSGLPFAFDFRENAQEPSVIHMPQWGVHWQRIAPNFETFLCLLEGYEER